MTIKIITFSILTIFSFGCNQKLTVPQNLKQYADGLFDKAYMDKLPGGVVVIAQGDEVIYRGAKGLGSIELGVPLNVNQVFRIGSVTKQFTAVAILALMDEGKLKLDDPLSNYLPEYPNGDNIKILHLLNHTSGVRSYTRIEGLMNGPIRLDKATGELIESFKNLPVDFQPGSNFSYNNSGYVLLGAVIEAITKKPWYEYMETKFFKPNNMKQTEYGGNERLILNMASGYSTVKLKNGKGSNLSPAGYVSMTQPHAAGALVSSAEDLIRWNRLLHGGKLLKPETYEMMVTPQGAAKDYYYGFGIERKKLRGKITYEHGGGIHGFSSYLVYLPEPEISVAIIQNSDVSPILDIKHSELAIRMIAFVLNQPFPEPTPISLSVSELKKYEGVYKINEKETRTIRVLNDVLTAQRSGGVPIKLMPIGDDKFLFPKGFDMITFSKVSESVDGLYFISETDYVKGKYSKRISHELPNLLDIIEKKDKERVIGKYEGRPGIMTIRINNDGELTGQLEGQDKFVFTPLSKNLYFFSDAGASLLFAPGQPAPKVKLSQGGRSTVLKRIESN